MEFGEFVFPEAEEREIAIRSGDTWRQIDKFKAIVSESGEVYAIVSKNYKLVQHKEVYDLTNKVLKEFGIEPIAARPEFSLNGAIMFYKVLTSEKKINIDTIRFGLMVTNSYDLSVGLNVMGFGMNMTCMNQMVFGREILKIKKKHFEGSVGVDLENLKKAIEDVLDAVEQIHDIIAAAMDKKVTLLEVISLVSSLRLSLKGTRKVLALIQKYTKVDTGEALRAIIDKKTNEKMKEIVVGTRWQVYNALTDFITHHLKSKDKSKELELHNKAVKVLVKAR